jgi:hypothetical protein
MARLCLLPLLLAIAGCASSGSPSARGIMVSTADPAVFKDACEQAGTAVDVTWGASTPERLSGTVAGGEVVVTFGEVEFMAGETWPTAEGETAGLVVVKSAELGRLQLWVQRYASAVAEVDPLAKLMGEGVD